MVYPARSTARVYYKGGWDAEYAPIIGQIWPGRSVDLDHLDRVSHPFLQEGQGRPLDCFTGHTGRRGEIKNGRDTWVEFFQSQALAPYPDDDQPVGCPIDSHQYAGDDQRPECPDQQVSDHLKP